MGFHVMILTDTASGEPADLVRADEAGGLLNDLGPSFSASLDELTVTLYLDGDDMGEALRSGVEAALRAFEAAQEPLTLRSVTVYTEAEFDRLLEAPRPDRS